MAEQETGEVLRVDTLLDSLLESADTAERLALNVAAEMGFEEEDMHRLGVAVRESVVNAVVHGNRYSARKKVRFTVASNQRGLIITVADEGQGFDWAALRNPLAEENLLEQSGRGLFLVRAFVDQVEFRRLTPQGTEVTLVKHRKKMVG